MNTETNQNQTAENFRNKILAESAELQNQLATRNGFVKYYFKILPKCESQNAAFQLTSVIYELLFDSLLFSCYDTFRKEKNKHLKG